MKTWDKKLLFLWPRSRFWPDGMRSGPERLVVNRQVDEAMPSAQSSSSTQPLESGQFYSILHPTQGKQIIFLPDERRNACSSLDKLSHVQRS